jgi:hypothetical protein
MNEQATRDTALPPDDSRATQGPGPALTTEAPVCVPQPQVVVPGAAARWWDAHPAQLPQSTILWNDEPACSSGGAGSPVAATGAVAIWGD